jgi:hypothetical protein
MSLTSFKADLNNLPTNYDNSTSQTFASFISKWGTHYITEATVGGRTTYTSFVTKSQEETFTSQDINVQAGMNAAFAVTVGVNVGVSTNNTNYKAITQQGISINAFALGG